MTSKQQRSTTPEERAATRVAGEGINPAKFDKETRDQQDHDVFTIAELAAQYVSLGGNDPRALKVFQAAQKAGHINANGEYVGPSTNGPRTEADELLGQGIDMDGCDELLAMLNKGDDE